MLLVSVHPLFAQDNQLLNQYRRMALNYDQQVQAAELNVAAAASNIKAAAADYKPKLSAGATYNWVQNPMELTLPMGGVPTTISGMNENYGLQASWFNLFMPVVLSGTSTPFGNRKRTWRKVCRKR